MIDSQGGSASLPPQHPSQTSALRASTHQVSAIDVTQSVSLSLHIRAGFQVSGAENGEQAWEALQCVHYHLVITDYLMPKASGLELARRMRGAGMMQPVILISGSRDLEKQVADSKIPIDVVLPKPFSFYELLNRINAVLDLLPRASPGARIFKSPQR